MKLLHISDDIQLKLDEVIGRLIAILGIRGSGKTNTSAVILEELLKYNMPLTIVDIDGEYWGLKEKYGILAVGKSENVDVKIEIEHAEYVAEVSISKNVPVILDVSGYLSEEIYKLLFKYSKRIWDLAGKFRKPYMIVLEEAHEFIPQGIKTDLKEVITRIALRGRKRGLGAIIISQRSAKVEKDVLSQAEILFLHKVVHPADLKVYKEILPLPSKDVVDMVTALNVGECIFYYGEICKPIKIRLRETFHAGYTPTLKEINPPKLKTISIEIINYLEKITKTEKSKLDEISRLKFEIKKLKEEIKEKDEIIQKLYSELSVLRTIKVEIPSITMVSNKDITTEEPIQHTIQSLPYKVYDLEHIPFDVKKKLDIFLKRIYKLPKVKKEVLKFLVMHDSKKYSYNQLADWLGYSIKTLYSSKLRDLVKLKIIKYVRIGRKIYLYSDMTNFLKQEFYNYIENENLKRTIKQYILNKLFEL